MPILTAIGSLLVSVVSFLASVIGRKALVASAAISAAFALTVAMVVCIGLLVQKVQAVLAIPPFIQTVAWFVPFDFSLCISSIFAGRTCRAAYDLAMEKIRLVNAAS